VAAGTLVGDNKADTATIWPTTSAIKTYGSAVDGWNASLTPTIVNSVDFGVVLSAQANISNADIGSDFIRMTVHYTEPASVSGSFTADAIIKSAVAGSFTANAVIRNAVTGSFTVDAVVRRTETASFAADAMLRRTESGSFTANAVISSIVSGSFTLDAEIGAFVPAGAAWVAPPADAEAVTDTTPTFTFNMPPAATGDMYFEIHLDTVNTFDSGNLLVYRSYPDATGWEYYNGSAWTPMPASGVPVAHVGRQGRFTVPSPLSNNTWFRRVRAGS